MRLLLRPTPRGSRPRDDFPDMVAVRKTRREDRCWGSWARLPPDLAHGAHLPPRPRRGGYALTMRLRSAPVPAPPLRLSASSRTRNRPVLLVAPPNCDLDGVPT